MWSLNRVIPALRSWWCLPGQAPVSSTGELPPDQVVVFVHGMGKALKGGTLQEWAQPLAQSFRDYALDDVGCLTCAPLIITDASAVIDTPSIRARVLRRHNPGPGAEHHPEYATILITEASWGADFVPATATDTYSWAWTMMPKVYGRSMELLWWNLYAGRPSRSNPFWLLKRIKQVILSASTAVLGFVVLIPGLALLGVVIFLANVPGLGRFVGAFVGLFAEFLGDPQVWLRRPLQAAAMRQRIIRTLSPWNALGIPITLVAHSQGASVSAQVLFQKGLSGCSAQVTNFVTVGSGVGLLGYAKWGGNGTDPVEDWMHNTRFRWINMWGKFDFVPAGPISTDHNGTRPVFENLFDRNNPKNPAPGPGPEEHAIYNRAALIYDHIVYSRNRVEVIDPLARLVLPPVVGGGAPAPAPVGIPIGNPTDRRLRPHRVMVKSLAATRALAFIAGVGLAPPIMSWLSTLKPLQAALQCSPADGAEVQWWVAWFCSYGGFSWQAPGTWPSNAVAAALIAAFYIAVLNGPLWNWLHGLVERRRKRTLSQLRPNRKPGDLPRRGPLTDAGNPWPWVWLYAAGVWTATLLPLYFVAGPTMAAVGVGTALVLVYESNRGTGVEPLASRPPRQP